MADKSGLLEGKDEIMQFLHTTEYKLKKYVAMGMPVVIEDGRWLAHKDNIDEFFKAYTRRKFEGIIPD
jgi:hypothetical protein